LAESRTPVFCALASVGLHAHYRRCPSPAAAPALAVATPCRRGFFWRLLKPFADRCVHPPPMLIAYGLPPPRFCCFTACRFPAGSAALPSLAHMEAVGRALSNDPCLAGLTKKRAQSQAWRASALHPPARPLLSGETAIPQPSRPAFARRRHAGYAFRPTRQGLLPASDRRQRISFPQPAARAGCERFNRKALALLQADRNIRVVVLAAAWSAPLNEPGRMGWLVSDPAHESEIPPGSKLQAIRRLLEGDPSTHSRPGKTGHCGRGRTSFEIDLLVEGQVHAHPRTPQTRNMAGHSGRHRPGFASPNPNPNFALADSLLRRPLPVHRLCRWSNLNPPCAVPLLNAPTDSEKTCSIVTPATFPTLELSTPSANFRLPEPMSEPTTKSSDLRIASLGNMETMSPLAEFTFHISPAMRSPRVDTAIK